MISRYASYRLEVEMPGLPAGYRIVKLVNYIDHPEDGEPAVHVVVTGLIFRGDVFEDAMSICYPDTVEACAVEGLSVMLDHGLRLKVDALSRGS